MPNSPNHLSLIKSMNQVSQNSTDTGITNAQNLLQEKLQGSPFHRFIAELFNNSGHFLIVEISAEIALSSSWYQFFHNPTEYLLIITMLVQTWYLSRSNANRFLGNLIGVSLYTLIDVPEDGLEFFAQPIHMIFWLFSILIAILQGLTNYYSPQVLKLSLLLEKIVRTFLICVYYIVISMESHLLPVENLNILLTFISQPQNRFLILSLFFVGLLLGLQSLQIYQQQEQLKNIAKMLGNMAEWGMGSHVVMTALTNPNNLVFKKCDRTIIFMDIRGFTSWCETTTPDQVAEVLNLYYQAVEPNATFYQPIKVTFTADEVMAIYETPHVAIQASLAMQQASQQVLSKYGLGAGCGIHCGQVIEGLFGSEGVRTYTVIGDVVNTTKRIEGATLAGEITISDTVYQIIGESVQAIALSPLLVKGKAQELKVWQLVKMN